ncbi:unnamed protein product [Effrenium voratum]|uniref:Cytochrome b5 heme-binding domain-containing protein n=1 Tax=Effrenium voratum TaxID=2562239 RepID=A0AA36NEY5_9DINO|nr:unnamed protein product [Effrenium voratum]CAJ1460285.1 unnamed protein product [Effrenium voratum]
MTVISLEELSKHTAPNDTWMAIHGLVYDTSGFMTEHPGGAQLLESVAGQDASAEFEDALHSTAARTEEKISCKGVLAGSEKQVQRFREAGWDESMGVPDPEALIGKSGMSLPSTAIFLLVGAVAAAAAAWFIASRKK